MRYSRRQQKKDAAEDLRRWQEEEEARAVADEYLRKSRLHWEEVAATRAADRQSAREANIQRRMAARKRLEEELERAHQIDDSDPEANLEAIMRKAQEFDASYAPSFYDEAPPATDDAPPSDVTLPRHSHEPELEPYGSRVLDPKRFVKMAAQRRAIEQAKREAWTNSFAVKQEAERAAREARTVARRAEQDAKRGVMKQARQDAARALARALERATAANAATLRELVRYPED